MNKNRPHVWQIVKEKVKERDGFRCIRCGWEEKKKMKIDGFVEWKTNLEVDHILPMKLGGAELDVNNLQTLCFICHDKKNRFDQSLIAKYKREVPNHE